MMAWIDPKTDWKGPGGNEPGDEYNLDPDYNRQTENLRVLYEEAKPVAGVWPLETMRAYTTANLPYADELNRVEGNYDALCRRIHPTGIYPNRRVLEDEGPQWDHDDFNRIESVTLELRGIIPRSLGSASTLDFTIGGEEFDS